MTGIFPRCEHKYPPEYYENPCIQWPVSVLVREYELIQKAVPDYKAIPCHNKIILHYQHLEFFKKEISAWLANENGFRERLCANRLKHIEKGLGDLSWFDVCRGVKVSRMIRGWNSYSHFSQQWLRKFIQDYEVKSLYDPCGGWGHRLTALSPDFPYQYQDINAPVVENCEKISSFLGMKNKEFYCADSSAWTPEGDVDAVFTCPPYGNTEIYSDKGAENLPPDAFLVWWNDVVRQSLKKKPRLFAFVINHIWKEKMQCVCEMCGLMLIAQHEIGANIKNHYQRLAQNSRKKEFLLIFSLPSGTI